MSWQEVNTVDGTATVKIDITFYWTDPRLVGYDYQTLPSKLWGPRLDLQDVVGSSIEETQIAFQQVESGRFFDQNDMICKAAAEFGCDYPRMDFYKKDGDGNPLFGAKNGEADTLAWPESGCLMRKIQYIATINNPMSAIGALSPRFLPVHF